MFQEENVCDEISLIFSNVVGFVWFVCFQQHYLTASVVQTKQHSLKPTNKKKLIALFVQYHYKREVYCERTVQVERPLHNLLSKGQ